MATEAVYPDLAGKPVLITGGGSGIGAALTRGFTRQGARVAFIDIAQEASEALVGSIASEGHARPLFVHADLADVEALREAVRIAEDAHGPALVLVNNAARDDRHDLADVTVDYWDANQAINLRPHFFAAQAVAEGMKRAGTGSIINFTSTSFLINLGTLPSYTAAKAGIVGLTKGLAGALGPHGIRVNAIAPGWVMTERQRALWVTDEALAAHVAKQCIKEEMRPDDVVGPCLFLASDAARMLTAQTLIVDGGYL
jgi:NAD(P)-dependent dehydrogenase (short-subunit alcohol dehydrogenase family)